MRDDREHIDKVLLSAIALGDETAFVQLFHAYKDKLYSFILQLTMSSVMSEDVLQDVFLKIWQHPIQPSEIRNFSSYLFRMAHNQAINGLRRRSRGALILEKFHRETSNGAYTEDPLLAKELRTILQLAIDRLPPQQRRIFELNRSQGLKYEEIAVELNISASTVRNHMLQARKFIQAFFQSSYPNGVI